MVKFFLSTSNDPKTAKRNVKRKLHSMNRIASKFYNAHNGDLEDRDVSEIWCDVKAQFKI